MQIEFVKVRDVKTPNRGTSESAGLDFFIPNDYIGFALEPQKDVLIPSGIHVKFPSGYVLKAYNKSGVATKLKLILGACVGEETLIRTNKGLLNVSSLTKERVVRDNIMLLAYNIENNSTEYVNFDGFRISSTKECVKITYDDDSTEIVSTDHLILNDKNEWIIASQSESTTHAKYIE